MKLDLSEIWEFMELVPEPRGTEQGNQWIYELVAGQSIISHLSAEDLLNLRNEHHYDTELLPSIFTFREVLWQPNVYKNPNFCIPQLNILKVFCEEFEEEFLREKGIEHWPFSQLLKDLAQYCHKASERLSKAENQKESDLASILGEFRRKAFPIVKFFIFHPSNRKDYHFDAINRLNYAVKIMLTQYNNKYFELKDPYWNVSVGQNQEVKNRKVASSTKENKIRTGSDLN